MDVNDKSRFIAVFLEISKNCDIFFYMKVQKIVFAMVFMLISNICAFAQDEKKAAVGIGPEFNMNSRKNFAVGAVASFDYNLASSFAAGLNLTGSNNFHGFSVIESAAAFRWYFFGDGHTTWFAQADVGVSLLLENGDTTPKFLGGLRGGYRLPLGTNFYVEPYGRFGYPFAFGIGVIAGITLPVKKDEFKDGIRIVRDGDDNLRIQVTSIIFSATRADFEGLSGEVLQNNMTTLRRVAALLNKYKNYRVTIEGHANPTSPEGSRRDQEERSFMRLSEQRASKIADELVKLGIDRSRITVTGAGTSKLLSPWNDNDNNWKNRRVEFILIR